MKYLVAATFILGLYVCLTSCNADNKDQTSAVAVDTASADIGKIQTVIRKALTWANSNKTIDLLPTIEKDSIYIGFNLLEHKTNLQKLKKTGLFSVAFIENYNQILLTLDKKLRNKELTWHVGDLPDFGFADDVDPWCNCQDHPDNDPWNHLQVQVINLNSQKGDLTWKWGNLDDNYGDDWKNFAYKFSVEKENGKWKISKMEGFNLNDAKGAK